MQRPKAKLVAIDGGTAPARWQGEDDIFFHKDQVRVRTRLLNFGRKDHGTLWEVVEVKTYRIARTGRAIPVKAGEVQKLTDDIVIRRVGANEIRQVSFASLSYSAIWRLA